MENRKKRPSVPRGRKSKGGNRRGMKSANKKSAETKSGEKKNSVGTAAEFDGGRKRRQEN